MKNRADAVAVTNSRQQFEWWDKESNTVRPPSGKYELLIGSSSDDALMKRISVSFNK